MRIIVLASLLFATSSLFANPVILPNFQVYAQPDGISCGPTSASMVLKYFGISAGIGPLKTQADTRWFEYGDKKVGMTLPSKLRDAIRSYGLPADLYTSSTTDLIRYLDQGRPPILLTRSGHDTWHYVVVVGYENNGARFYLADPGGARLWWIDRHALEGAWQFSADLDGHYIPDDTCGACHGKGKMWTECPTCHGSGYIKDPVFHTKNKCPFCSGQGKWQAKCVRCGGKGTVGDLYRKVVESAGAVGHSLIVPMRSAPNFPGNRYALTCIHNKTNIPINFQYHYGDNGNWENVKVEPGHIRAQWWNYQFVNENSSPKLHVRFDSDLSGGNHQKQYWLKAYASTHTDCTKQKNREEFQRKAGATNELDLFHYDN